MRNTGHSNVLPPHSGLNHNHRHIGSCLCLNLVSTHFTIQNCHSEIWIRWQFRVCQKSNEHDQYCGKGTKFIQPATAPVLQPSIDTFSHSAKNCHTVLMIMEDDVMVARVEFFITVVKVISILFTALIMSLKMMKVMK